MLKTFPALETRDLVLIYSLNREQLHPDFLTSQEKFTEQSCVSPIDKLKLEIKGRRH